MRFCSLKLCHTVVGCALTCALIGQDARAANVSIESVSQAPLHQTLVPAWVAIEYSAAEEGLFAEAAAGRLNGRTLWRAALVASGKTDPARLPETEQHLEEWCEELRGLVPADGSDWDRAKIVFEFMHRRILTGGYDPQCSDVALVADEGRYNCISSTILLQSLAERVGLRAAGGESPGHAFCWLWMEGRRVAIETTNPQWFASFKSSSNSADDAGFAGLSADQTLASRELSAAELTAMIYYNRGFLLLREKQFAAAIAANAKALRLDPASDVSRDNLLAAINNWALDLSDRGEFERAVDLLLHGLKVAPHHRPFQVNLAVVRQRASLD